MYVSRTQSGRPTPVTGLVFVPPAPPPPGGYPVVSWAHGTNGMAPMCAPSLSPSSAAPLLSMLLAQGDEVVATDYEGEGTPGLLPYLVGDVAAYDAIDIVRAVQQLRAAHASRRYVVWGHSEGGQTALFALELGPRYAPQLRLEGVVATAPPSQLMLIYQALKNSPFRFYIMMVGVGFHVAYGHRAPLGEIATPLALRLIPELAKGCGAHIVSVVDRYPLSALISKDPASVPAWRALIEANDPESFSDPSPAPLLIIHGSADEEIPVVSSQLLAQHLCAIGQDLERWVYPGYHHTNVIPASAPDMLRWIADRFAGVHNPDPYVPHAVPGIETTVCAGKPRV
jgi:dipeptidyl aminopeptidase/acylaminoacyl peptidase